MLCFPPLFLVIIIPNRENRSVSTIIEYFHEPSTIDSDHTGNVGIKSVALKKASERLEVLRTAKYNIGHGEKRAFNITVGSKVTLLDLYLDWGNVNFSLLLTSYPPGGPIANFDDSYNQTKDGKIVVRIHPKTGTYIKQGDWKFTVYGQKVDGIDDYTFKAVAHVSI
jgi:hypothetical protein